MNIGIYKSASAMVALDRWQQQISQNIAAGSVPGYKKIESTFEAKMAEMERYGSDGRAMKEERGVMPVAVSQISLNPGEIRSTGNETDFAIQGRGFFKVQTDGGQVGYTRDGEFHTNAERTLVNKQGFPVLGESGPITFKPEGGAISVSPDGTVAQGEQAVGKLPIYDFKDTDKLRRMGDGMLTAEDSSVQPKPVQSPQVAGGVLEMSNVQPLQEMVNLITVSRAYESNQKVITSNDELLDKAIQSLGATA
jgi:flagellar basal-body rod protein FlgF